MSSEVLYLILDMSELSYCLLIFVCVASVGLLLCPWTRRNDVTKENKKTPTHQNHFPIFYTTYVYYQSSHIYILSLDIFISFCSCLAKSEYQSVHKNLEIFSVTIQTIYANQYVWNFIIFKNEISFIIFWIPPWV